MKERFFSNAEAATAHVKIDGLIRVMAISMTAVFWAGVALLGLGLYLINLEEAERIARLGQAAISAGLAPIPAILGTWRAVEWAISSFLNAYARHHLK